LPRLIATHSHVGDAVEAHQAADHDVLDETVQPVTVPRRAQLEAKNGPAR
jgi:hypothetical protein